MTSPAPKRRGWQTSGPCSRSDAASGAKTGTWPRSSTVSWLLAVTWRYLPPPGGEHTLAILASGLRPLLRSLGGSLRGSSGGCKLRRFERPFAAAARHAAVGEGGQRGE